MVTILQPPPEPQINRRSIRGVFLGVPQSPLDWLVALVGYGLPLLIFVDTYSVRDDYRSLGPWIVMVGTCGFGSSVGLVGLLSGRRMSGWIIPFTWILLWLWSPSDSAPVPPPPRVEGWGKTGVRSLAVLSRGRIALCGTAQELVIVDPAGAASFYPPPKEQFWCGGPIRPVGDGFLTWNSHILWTNGQGNDHVVLVPTNTGDIADMVMLPSGTIRIIGIVDQTREEPIPAGEATQTVYEESTFRVTDVAPDGSSHTIAQIPKLNDPGFHWEGGVLFEDGSAALYSTKFFRMSSAGVLDPHGERGCPVSGVHAIHPMSAFFFPASFCFDADLWKMDSGRVTAIHLEPKPERRDVIGQVIDAGKDGFFLARESGIAHYDSDGNLRPFHLTAYPDQSFWDGSGLITLQNGIPRRYLADGAVDENFPWPTIQTTYDPATNKTTVNVSR